MWEGEGFIHPIVLKSTVSDGIGVALWLDVPVYIRRYWPDSAWLHWFCSLSGPSHQVRVKNLQFILCFDRAHLDPNKHVVERARMPPGTRAETSPPPLPPPTIPNNLLWPRPAEFTSGHQTIAVHPNLTYSIVSAASSARLERAFDRYKNLTFASGCNIPASAMHPTMTFLRQIVVHLAHGDDHVATAEGADESYTLTIPADSPQATINSSTPFGAIRALETLAQLVRPHNVVMPSSCSFINLQYDRLTYVIESVPWYVSDTPRYQHRGLLLDTARHYFPVSYIEKILDGMAYTKLNVLHWHIVDSQVS